MFGGGAPVAGVLKERESCCFLQLCESVPFEVLSCCCIFFLFVCFYSEVLRYGNNFSLLVDFVTYEGKTLQHNPVQ